MGNAVLGGWAIAVVGNLLLWATAVASHAQRPDSLLAVLARPGLADTARARTLCDLCRARQFAGQTAEALDAGRKGLALALRVGPPATVALCQNNIAQAHRNGGNLDSAFAYFEMAMQGATQQADTATMADLFSLMAVAHSEMGNIRLAIQLIRTALDYAILIRDSQREASFLLNLGSFYIYNNQLHEGMGHLLKAYEMCQAQSDEIGMFVALSNLHIIYVNMRELDKARTVLLRSFEILKTLPDRRHEMSSTFYNYGNVLSEEHKLDSALYYFKLSEAAARAGTNPIDIAYALAASAFTLKQMGRLAEVLPKLEEAERLLAGNPYEANFAYVNQELADYWRLMNNHAKARRFARKAVRLSRQTQNRSLEQSGLMLLSRIDSAMGNWADAFAHLSRALVLNDSLLADKKAEELGRLAAEFEYRQRNLVSVQIKQALQAMAHARQARSRHLQFFGIGICVLAMVLAGLRSNRLRLRPRLRQFVLFAGLLLAFEFLLVLIDPFMDARAPEPIYKLALNALLALGIAPLHGRLNALLRKPQPNGERPRL